MRAILLLSPALILAVAPAVAQQPNNNSVGRVVTQPLRDVRLKEDKIPEILQLAATAPYSNAHTGNCAAITSEVRALDKALGADADTPSKTRGEGSAIAATGARAVVGTLIPGLGLVRVLTGADKAQRRAEAAVYAGAVRRGYLKGIGLAKRCGVPARPTAAAVAMQPELLEKED